jgi:hypothetical protein
MNKYNERKNIKGIYEASSSYRDEGFSVDYLIEQMQRNYERFSAPYLMLIKENNDLRVELNVKTQEVNTLKAQLAHEIAPQKDELVRLQGENAILYSQLDDLTTRHKKLQKIINN